MSDHLFLQGKCLKSERAFWCCEITPELNNLYFHCSVISYYCLTQEDDQRQKRVQQPVKQSLL